MPILGALRRLVFFFPRMTRGYLETELDRLKALDKARPGRYARDISACERDLAKLKGQAEMDRRG